MTASLKTPGSGAGHFFAKSALASALGAFFLSPLWPHASEAPPLDLEENTSFVFDYDFPDLGEDRIREIMQGSSSVYSNLVALNRAEVLDVLPDFVSYWNIEGAAPLKFNYLQQEADGFESSALLSFYSDSSHEISRALDLKVKSSLQDGPFGIGSAIYHLSSDPFQARSSLTFKAPVSIQAQNIEGSLTPVIRLNENSNTVFEKELSVSELHTPDLVLTSVGVQGMRGTSTKLTLKGASSFSTLGTAFDIGSTGTVIFEGSADERPRNSVRASTAFRGYGSLISNDSLLSIKAETGFADHVKGAFINSDLTLVARTGFSDVGSFKIEQSSLLVDAPQALIGEGAFFIKNSDVRINGDTDGFKGTYRQIGGSLVHAGNAGFNSERWLFDGVSVTTDSKNLFEISAAQHDPVRHGILQGKITMSPQEAFSEIVLTDEEVTLNYLTQASEYYKGADITYTGALKVDGRVITHISLDKDFGVLSDNKIGLASVNLDLGESSSISGRHINIGSFSGRGKEIEIDNSRIVLYGTGRSSITGNYERVRVGAGSLLEIHGIDYGNAARLADTRAYLSSKVEVLPGGKLYFAGRSTVRGTAKIINSGTVLFKEGSSSDFYADFEQLEGETTLSETSSFESNKAVKVLGGRMNVLGNLKSASMVLEGGELAISGSASGEHLFAGAPANRPPAAQRTLRFAPGSFAEYLNAQTYNAQFVIGESSARRAVKAGRSFTGAMVHLKNWKGAQSHFSVASGSALILGDDLSGDQTGFAKDDALWAVNSFGGYGRSLLALNETLVIGEGNRFEIGEQVSFAPSPQNVSSYLRMGSDSALLIRPQTGTAALSSSSEGKVSFAKGSELWVLDPFGENQLADGCFAEIDGWENLKAISLNKNVTLRLEREGDGSIFVRRQSLTPAPDFVYPTLQGSLYENAEDLTLDSGNAAKRFFARADNLAYLPAEQSRTVIGQATLLPSLLGTKVSTYSSGAAAVSETALQAGQAAQTPEIKTHVFGRAEGSLSRSKNLGGYLGEARFRADGQNILLGVVRKTSENSALSFSFQGGRISSKAYNSALKASGTQALFTLTASAFRQFGAFGLGGILSAGLSDGTLRAQLPSSMALSGIRNKTKDVFFSIGGEVSYPVLADTYLNIAPRMWIFPGLQEKTAIGAQKAFALENRTRSFAEVPLKVSFNRKLATFKDSEIRFAADVGAAVKVGQLDKKGKLKAVGTTAFEDISQKQFSRWNAFTSASISAQAKRTSFELSAGVSSGDFGVAGRVQAKALWRF